MTATLALKGADPTDLQGRLQGRFAVLEPLREDHADDLFTAAQDGELFTWFPSDIASSRTAFDDGLQGRDWVHLARRQCLGHRHQCRGQADAAHPSV